MKKFISEYGFAIFAVITVIALMVIITPLTVKVKNEVSEIVTNFDATTKNVFEPNFFIENKDKSEQSEEVLIESIPSDFMYSDEAETILIAYTGNAEKIVVPEQVQVIKAHVFEGNSAKTIVLPENLRSIEEWAFAFMDNIESLNIPFDVEYIGSQAFFNIKHINYSGIAEWDEWDINWGALSLN